MAEKPVRIGDAVDVVYSEDRWRCFERLRAKATRIMEALSRSGLWSIIYGSVARGDVTPRSDVDVFIPYITSSFLVESALERLSLPIARREIVQATPSHTPKAYIYIDKSTTISFPLTTLGAYERDFYRFGGELNVDEVKDDGGRRKAGVDKRLLLIEPTPYGHKETPIIGKEAEVAKMLEVSLGLVKERVRVLTRRDEIGRTGIYLKHILPPSKSFEDTLEELAARNPALRRKLMEKP